MMKERRWFQIGTGLGLFLLCVVALAGCAKVYVNCPPPEAMRDNNSPPTGMPLKTCNYNGNTCTGQPIPCACNK